MYKARLQTRFFSLEDSGIGRKKYGIGRKRGDGGVMGEALKDKRGVLFSIQICRRRNASLARVIKLTGFFLEVDSRRRSLATVVRVTVVFSLFPFARRICDSSLIIDKGVPAN